MKVGTGKDAATEYGAMFEAMTFPASTKAILQNAKAVSGLRVCHACRTCLYVVWVNI